MSDNNNNIVPTITENVIYPPAHANQEAKQAGKATANFTELYENKAEDSMSRGIDNAKVKASEATTQTGQAMDQFEAAMSAKTDQAVNEGKHDVNDVKTTSVGYVQQAKDTITDVANAAQEYVSVGLEEHTPVDPNAPQGTGVVSSLQSAANAAYEKGKSYLATAQETAEPHVRRAQETIQPHAESLMEAAKPYVNKAQSTLSSVLGTGTTDQDGRDDTPRV